MSQLFRRRIHWTWCLVRRSVISVGFAAAFCSGPSPRGHVQFMSLTATDRATPERFCRAVALRRLDARHGYDVALSVRRAGGRSDTWSRPFGVLYNAHGDENYDFVVLRLVVSGPVSGPWSSVVRSVVLRSVWHLLQRLLQPGASRLCYRPVCVTSRRLLQPGAGRLCPETLSRRLRPQRHRHQRRRHLAQDAASRMSARHRRLGTCARARARRTCARGVWQRRHTWHRDAARDACSGGGGGDERGEGHASLHDHYGDTRWVGWGYSPHFTAPVVTQGGWAEHSDPTSQPVTWSGQAHWAEGSNLISDTGVRVTLTLTGREREGCLHVCLRLCRCVRVCVCILHKHVYIV